MRNGTRVLFLASSVLAAASFLGAQCFTPPAGGGMLGPSAANGDAPAFLDNGDGVPSCGDTPIVPTYDSQLDRITIPSPYVNCDGSGSMHDQFDLLRDKSGMPVQLFRDRGDQIEVLTPTGFFAPFQPMSGHLAIMKSGNIVKEGDGHLVSGGGFFSGVSGGQTMGGSMSATMSFVYMGKGGDGGPAYISLPWSQVAGLGILATSCPTPVPQIFVPLSNGRIVLDLNGDGVPDPGFFSSPPLTAKAAVGPGIPTVSRGTMALLAAAFVGAGLFQLRRGGLGF